MVKKAKRWRLLSTAILTVLVLLVLAWAWFGWVRANIHSVIPDQVYRSAELGPAALKRIVAAEHIRTIINLEGSHNADWYRYEIALSTARGIQHHNLELNAHHLPRLAQLKRLVSLLETSPRPILLHCHRGADRTGLASAIAVILSNKPNIAAARKQCSWRYLVISPNSIGKLVLRRYERWLLTSNRQNSAAAFVAWVNGLQTGGNYL